MPNNTDKLIAELRKEIAELKDEVLLYKACVAESEAELAQVKTVPHAASVILSDRWGGYGNHRARKAMWNFVYKQHNRHMLPCSHYDGVLQAGLRALVEDNDE